MGLHTDLPPESDPREPGDLLWDAYWRTYYVVLDIEKHDDLGTTKSITVLNLNQPNQSVASGTWDITTHMTPWHYGPRDKFVSYNVLEIDGLFIQDAKDWLAEMRDICANFQG